MSPPSRLRAAFLSVTATVALLVVIAAAVLISGRLDVAAVPKRTSWVDRVLAVASTRSIRRHAAAAPAAPANDSLLEGAAHYQEMCVTCHGAPGVERGDIGNGLNPVPPRLDSIAPNWTDPQLFWIVKHGIRMTGMPAAGGTHTDSQVSAIVAFVRRLPKMTPAEYRRVAELAKAMPNMSRENH